MAAKPSEAGAKAARWIAQRVADRYPPAPVDVARRFGLSPRQAQRLCAAAGIPPRSAGRPAL